MSVWAEKPYDGGSAVWGCSACEGGGWCSDHTAALIEARLHAKDHNERVTVLGAHRGPRPDTDRDRRIRQMRNEGMTIRHIATTMGISTGGVAKSLRRTT